MAPVSLPPPVVDILAAWNVPLDVRARLTDLHVFLGQRALDAFVEIAESSGRPPSELVPADLDSLREAAGERYLELSHPRWLDGEPTTGFWRDRTIEGAPTGIVTPLGDLEDPKDDLTRLVADAAARAAGPNQPRPQGLLLLSRNAHFGNRPGEFSIDLVPRDLEQAKAVNRGVGQQHTAPGSIGEASGTALSDPPIAVTWEIQPNIHKPSGDRNREANAAWRRHRNWHLIVAIGAFAWLRHNGYRCHVLRSQALQMAHEVNPAKPVTDQVRSNHDRTIDSALAALGLARTPLAEPSPEADALARILDMTLSHARRTMPLGDIVEAVTLASPNVPAWTPGPPQP
jgi:hypothetical protein